VNDTIDSSLINISDKLFKVHGRNDSTLVDDQTTNDTRDTKRGQSTSYRSKKSRNVKKESHFEQLIGDLKITD